MDRKFIGSVFMVSGCAMGAGSLALPMLAAGPGFVWSSLFIVLTGVFSYFLAIFTLEIYMINKNGENASTVALRNFGKPGAVFAAIVNLALMYAVLTVYMTGGADLLTKTLLPLINLDVSSHIGLLIFLVIFLPVFFNGTGVVVKSNTIVFYIKLFSFLIAIILGLKFFSRTIIYAPVINLEYLPRGLPIFFSALGFQFLVPILAQFNGYDRIRCRKILACGVLLPVVLYILWAGVMLSLVPRDGSGNTFFSLLSKDESVGTMISYATHNNPRLPELMKIALNVFSNMAMLTSFLSVGISLYEYIRDALKLKQNMNGKILNLTITMLPPIVFAFAYPNGFLLVLQQVSIFLILVCMLPVAALLREFGNLEIKLPKISIWFILIICGILISLQLLDDFHLLPAFGVLIN